jgi:hypothetical protein
MGGKERNAKSIHRLVEPAKGYLRGTCDLWRVLARATAGSRDLDLAPDDRSQVEAGQHKTLNRILKNPILPRLLKAQVQGGARRVGHPP